MSRPPVVLVIQNVQADADRDLRVDDGAIRTSRADSGYEIARARRPDIIAVDVSIAGETGWAVCRLLKRDPLTASIPVVVLSATDTPETAAHASYVGACAVLTARASVEELTAAVQSALTRSSAA